ncbi:sirohydrochlorin cobaltochelatase [Paratractidigestivibacter sp.]|uniref:sirohydrochlorin cobaltochelatase n=1 Tax=Paratractidigestivibacter sp. TaxID=2847316 RepID=UPI002AC89601|nr:sirohydrochlorin cobaltochelatase [Paratractidigestivibacter sp.]
MQGILFSSNGGNHADAQTSCLDTVCDQLVSDAGGDNDKPLCEIRSCASLFERVRAGDPTFDEVMALLAKGGHRRVRLSPLRLAAGDHAKNDMIGPDPDSWASRLIAAGYDVDVCLRGLGELAAVRQLYAAHSRDARPQGE